MFDFARDFSGITSVIAELCGADSTMIWHIWY